MKTHLRLLVAAVFLVLPVTAFAQAADNHHPADAAATAPATETAAAPGMTPPANPGPMPGNVPDQAAGMMSMMQGNMAQMMGMMQMMQNNMMQMMQMMQEEMAQGGMAQGGMAQGGMAQGMPAGSTGMAAGSAGMSDASKAYMGAMTTMNGPMMRGAQAADPDVAFVSAMIPHHQGAIDMAKAVLQYGKDPTVKEWANQIIAAQEAEIAKMQDWLKQRPQ